MRGHTPALLLALAICLLCESHAVAGQEVRLIDDELPALVELRHKRRVHIVASTRPVNVIDARKTEDEGRYARTVIAEVLNPQANKMKHVPQAYRQLSKPLKKYAKRYRSLELVDRPEDAEFLLIFYEVGKRRVFEVLEGMVTPGTFSVGFLLVVTMQPEPRVLLETDQALMAEYAVKGFIRELKIVRGEK